MKLLLVLSFITILLLLECIYVLRKKVVDLAELEKKQWSKAESNVMNKRLLVLWIEKKIGNHDISNYFSKRKFFRIAIYGMTEVGELLYKVLKDSDIQVVSCIDRGRKLLNIPIEIVRPKEFQENVDAIVVASIYYFPEIYDTLRKQVSSDVPIIGLDEVLFELAEDKQDE